MVKYLNPANHQPVRITKTDKEFENTHDFSDIKFPVKIRDIQKIYKKKKKNSIGINVFDYENKDIYPIYVSKQCC